MASNAQQAIGASAVDVGDAEDREAVSDHVDLLEGSSHRPESPPPPYETEYEPVHDPVLDEMKEPAALCLSAPHSYSMLDRGQLKAFSFVADILTGHKCNHFWTWLRADSPIKYLDCVWKLHPKEWLRLAKREYFRALEERKPGHVMFIRHRIQKFTAGTLEPRPRRHRVDWLVDDGTW